MKDKNGVDLKLVAQGQDSYPKKPKKPAMKLYVGFNEAPK